MFGNGADTIADQAITWLAYFKLAADLRRRADWKEAIAKLGKTCEYGEYEGDLLSRKIRCGRTGASLRWTRMGT
jgi:hypothetical protein